MNARARPPAVAGLFYPRDAAALREDILRLLAHAAAPLAAGSATEAAAADKAYIVPHAGYLYSGAVAAAAYARLQQRHPRPHRVVLIGPSHHADFQGLALPECEAFATPLGAVAVDTDVCARLRHDPDIIRSDAAHQHEHCLEVQLPFLQVVLGAFTLVPLLTGRASTADVARVLEAAWGDVGTIVVVSSDLSHYLAYAAARSLDAGTAASIAARAELRDPSRACGALAINGLLARARALDLAIEELARLNSGDTAGDRARVVGYGAWCLHAA